MRIRKRRILLLTLPVIIVAIAIGIMLLGQPAQPASESSPPPGSPTTPPNLLVVPEVPLGPVAVLVACFAALLIAQRITKGKLT